MSNKQGASYICVPTTGLAANLLPFVGLGVFLMVWFVVTDIEVVSKKFLPPPDDVLKAFFGMFHDAPKMVIDDETKLLRPVQSGWDFVRHTSGVSGIIATCHRILSAVWWSCLVGIPIGVVMGAFGKFESFLSFLIPPMRNAPITAFIPLFMLLFGIDESLKVNFLMFGTLVYIIPTTFDAVRNVPQEYIDRGVDLGFKPLGVLWYYVLPASAARIFEGVGICTGIAWTYVVAAETINVTNGIGALIAGAQRNQNTPKMYAGILLIMILGVVTAYLFKVGQRHPLLKPEGAR